MPGRMGRRAKGNDGLELGALPEVVVNVTRPVAARDKQEREPPFGNKKRALGRTRFLAKKGYRRRGAARSLLYSRKRGRRPESAGWTGR